MEKVADSFRHISSYAKTTDIRSEYWAVGMNNLLLANEFLVDL